MAVLISATDLAIGLAAQRGAIRLVERASRLGGMFVAVEDDRSVIEVHATMADAERRVAAIREATR